MLRRVDIADELLAAPGDGFNIPRPFGSITQRLAQLAHSAIDCIIVIDMNTRRPEYVLDLLPVYDFATAFQQ
jgi:hypothetical protein